MDTSSAEFQAALRDHAKSLGVDPDADPHLLSLVQEALLAEIPDGWEQGETEDGTLYYFNSNTEESIWEHPLDAHYRDLIKQKKAEGPPTKSAPATAPAIVETKSEASKLEVYSFDDDSDDDDVRPVGKATAANETKPASRLSSLFSSPEPAPSFSATSAAMTTVASVKESVKESAVVSTAPSSTGGGFGRDRSWLLDNDEDLDIPTLPVSKPTTLTPSTSMDSGRPLTGDSSSRPSFTSRLFGGASGVTSSPVISGASSTTTSTTTITPLDLGSTNSSGGSKTSPRRGIASAIKGPFFQEMPSTVASTVSSISSGLSSTATASSSAYGIPNAADAAKIKELEKKTSDLQKQLEQAKSDHESTKQQLETAKQEAKEANYLKMKASESKTKLTEKETELAKAKQEVSSLRDELLRSQSECEILKQSQQTTTQREIVEAKKASSELQNQLKTSQKQCQEMELLVQETRQEVERLTRQLSETKAAGESQVRETKASVETQINETKAAGERQLRELTAAVEAEKKANATLGEQCEREKTHARGLQEQLEKLKQELFDMSRKSESSSVLQDTLDRQTKYAREIEEKQKELQAKLIECEAKEMQAIRETKTKELENQDLNRKITNLTHDVEARDKQLRDLQDALRNEQAQAIEIQAKARAQQQNEQDFERKRQFWEKEKQDLATQVVLKNDQLQALQSKLAQAQEDHSSVHAKLQSEVQSLTLQLRQVKSHEVVPLEKQRDQLNHETERLREKLASVDKDLRQVQQEFASETSKTHQLQVEIEAWKRKEQQQKAQKESYLAEKTSLETQLQSSQSEASTYKHDKRLEMEKMAFRLRELESQVAQKDYELVRCEEKFTKAEAWRLKEARRVDERDVQMLDLKEELAQLKSRNIDAENNAIIHELRREKEVLDGKLKTLQHELEEERIAKQVAAQRFQDEAEQLQKNIEWQLPQLAAACVNRSSEEWTRKCNDLVKNLRDEWNMKALSERNEILQRLKDCDERRDHAEQKLKNAMSECEFLRKEVHRVEDNNKVLLDQLHTIRVFMTQRAGTSGFYPSMGPSPQPQQSQSHQTTASPPPSAPPPAPSTASSSHSDYAAVNHLNAQLAVLHAQFQQLFDAQSEPVRPLGRHFPSSYSPSDRFEIPSSPPARKPHHRPRDASPATSCSSSSSIDQTLDSLLEHSLLEKSARKSSQFREPHAEKEELLANLESLGGPGSLVPVLHQPMPTTGSHEDGNSWYQKNYWRSKYQQ